MPKTLFFALLASAVALIAAPNAQSEETKPAMTAATKAAAKPDFSGFAAALVAAVMAGFVSSDCAFG
ncbi:hypothetical protein EN742_21965, partial [Mesorhizobium sp. M4A.F.Ca.ET.020.02.1.1]